MHRPAASFEAKPRADRGLSPPSCLAPLSPNEREHGAIYQFLGRDYQAAYLTVRHFSGISQGFDLAGASEKEPR